VRPLQVEIGCATSLYLKTYLVSPNSLPFTNTFAKNGVIYKGQKAIAANF
jgi:hypothetical protein